MSLVSEYEHALVNVKQNAIGGSFNLTVESRGHTYKINVRHIKDGLEPSIHYESRNGVAVKWGEALPKTIKDEVWDWINNGFDTDLIAHEKNVFETLDKHRRIGIQSIEDKIERYEQLIITLKAELRKAQLGKGFNQYVDTDQ